MAGPLPHGRGSTWDLLAAQSVIHVTGSNRSNPAPNPDREEGDRLGIVALQF